MLTCTLLWTATWANPCPVPDVRPVDLPRAVEALGLQQDPDATAVLRMALEDASTQARDDCEAWQAAMDAAVRGSGGDPELLQRLRHRNAVIRQLNDARAVRNALQREQLRLGHSDALTQAIARSSQAIARHERTLRTDAIDGKTATQGARHRATAAMHELQALLLEQAVDRDTALAADIDALLAHPDERAAWARLQRTLRRSRMLPQGSVHGDRVDLLVLVPSLQETLSPEVQRELDQWAIQMHDALGQRHLASLTLPSTMRYWLTQGRITEASEAATTLARRNADIVLLTDAAVQTIGDLLPLESRSALLQRWRTIRMPGLQRPDPLRARALRWLETAPEDDPRRPKVARWLEGYDAEWLPLRDEAARSERDLCGRDAAIVLARRAGLAEAADIDLLESLQDIKAAMAETTIWWHQRLDALIGDASP